MTDAGRQSEAYFRDRYSIDRATASELLGVAMSRGGDRAELFFEHREGSNLSFEQQAVKSASRSITQGLGVRVLQGEAIGYAFTEDLSREAMRRAADTAARIASRGDTAPPVDVVHYESANHYEPSASTLSVPPAEKVELIRRADAAARRFDPCIARVDINFIDELKHVMIVTSDGRIAGDVQPLVRFNVVVPVGARGQAARTRAGAAAGAWAWRTSTRTRPKSLARRGGAAGGAAADGDRGAGRHVPGGARRGRLAASCCTRRSATGWRPTSTASGRATTRTASASSSRRSCARSSTTARSTTAAARSTSTTRATRRAATC